MCNILSKERIWKIVVLGVIWRKEEVSSELSQRRVLGMEETIRSLFVKDAGKNAKMIAFLYDEKEYAEALVEHLILRFRWGIVLCDEIGTEVEESDLILAEGSWFEQLRDRDELWNKTVFLLEDKPQEIPMTRNEFPYLVWKYDGFAQIRKRIAEALEERCGRIVMTRKEEPPTLVVGAWDYREDEAWELANVLANEIKRNVLHINLEKFSGKDMKAALELNGCLEDILYYVLDRLEMDGIDTTETIRSLMDVKNGVCSLPPFRGFNPLLRLKQQHWNLLLNSLYEATEAEAVLMWMGREQMDRFPYESIDAIQCIYIKPEELSEREELRWNHMKYGMEYELNNLHHVELKMVDSWFEAMEVIQKHGRDMAGFEG